VQVSSLWYAAFICLWSVWLAFALNLTAMEIESPFGRLANHLPLETLYRELRCAVRSARCALIVAAAAVAVVVVILVVVLVNIVVVVGVVIVVVVVVIVGDETDGNHLSSLCSVRLIHFSSLLSLLFSSFLAPLHLPPFH
jgi:hypothetical protein